MTRGLFAGAFWGLLTGGLVLTVAALVLDHRDSQPVPVPAYLASVDGSAPVFDWEPAATRTNVMALQVDPAVHPDHRTPRQPHEVFSLPAPKSLPETAGAPLVLHATTAPEGFEPALPAELKIVGPGSDAALARGLPAGPNEPAFSVSLGPLGGISPLPETAGIVAENLTFPAPPAVSELLLNDGQTPEGLTRSQYAAVATAPLASNPPEAVEDAAISAPVEIALSALEKLVEQPEATGFDAGAPINAPQQPPVQVSQLPRPQSVPANNAAPRLLSDPPRLIAQSEGIGEVIIVLLSDGDVTGPIPDWAAAVAGPPIGAISDRPVFAAIALDANASGIAETEALLNAAEDAAGLIVLPAASQEVSNAEEMATLVMQAPAVLGPVEAVTLSANIKPVYRWIQGSNEAVLQDLAAAQARASRDGQSIVVLRDTPSARAAVEAWAKALDPKQTKFGRLRFSGS